MQRRIGDICVFGENEVGKSHGWRLHKAELVILYPRKTRLGVTKQGLA